MKSLLPPLFKQLKSGKAPGICAIDAEMLKAGGMVAAEWLHRVIELAWAKGEVADGMQVLYHYIRRAVR